MLPTDAKERKALPIGTGVLDYFPLALAEVARVSKVGNDQHNPGQPLHWDRSKSTDESDALIRHFLERGRLDSDGTRHSAKVAWRALAMLEKEMEMEEVKAAVQAQQPPPLGGALGTAGQQAPPLFGFSQQQMPLQPGEYSPALNQKPVLGRNALGELVPVDKL